MINNAGLHFFQSDYICLILEEEDFHVRESSSVTAAPQLNTAKQTSTNHSHVKPDTILCVLVRHWLSTKKFKKPDKSINCNKHIKKSVEKCWSLTFVFFSYSRNINLCNTLSVVVILCILLLINCMQLYRLIYQPRWFISLTLTPDNLMFIWSCQTKNGPKLIALQRPLLS